MRLIHVKFIILFYAVFLSLPCSAQLKMAVLPEKIDTITIFPYDSLTNIKSLWRTNGDKHKFAHLVGQTITIVDDDGSASFADYYNKKINFKEMNGKAYKITNITNGNFGVIFHLQPQSGIAPTIQVTINESLGESVAETNWVCHGYYDKVKQLYLNTELVYVNNDQDYDLHYTTTDRFLDYATKENLKKKIPANSVWKCTDVLVLPGVVDVTHFASRVILNVENETYGKYYLYASDLIDNRDKDTKNFMTLEEFNKYTAYNNQLKAEAKTRAAEAAKQAAIKREERRKSILAKYGEYYGSAILQGNVIIGMTTEQCREAWGHPRRINRTTTAYGVSEQWVYGYRYLYFENGKLTAIQD